MNNEHLLQSIGDIDDSYIIDAAPTEGKKRKTTIWLRRIAVAACAVLLLGACFGTLGAVAEAEEYKAATQFFDEHGMSTEGLTREEIKAVYRDITTKSFSYSKTAQVIWSSISTDPVGGYEIMQNAPGTWNGETLWNYLNAGILVEQGEKGVHYKRRSEYEEDDTGFDHHKQSYLEKYDGETLLWSVAVSQYWIEGFDTVSDGIIAYGNTSTIDNYHTTRAWMAKIDPEGRLLWTRTLDHNYKQEHIAAVLDNGDGTYGVISRGDLEFFVLSRYTANGEELAFRQTKVGNYGIWNAARFADGYIVQLGSFVNNEHARIVKVDREGNITESFSYGDGASYYYITDMLEFNGNIYLSAYAVPRLADEEQSAGGRYEIAGVLNYLFDNGIWKISSEELTPMVQDNYTAMLLVCEPESGIPREFYSVKGSRGGALSVSDTGKLLWNVESIFSAAYSPATSAFTIAGASYVYRYAFDAAGLLISREATNELAGFHV